MKMNNAGQLCTSINRALVHESVADKFIELIRQKFEACRVGWPDNCDMGPMISEGERKRVVGLIDDAIANESDYGLSAYAYTTNLNSAFRFYKELEVGEVFINVWGGGSPLPYPHAGVKKSGIGADFSTDSLMEYMQVKRVCMTV